MLVGTPAGGGVEEEEKENRVIVINYVSPTL